MSGTIRNPHIQTLLVLAEADESSLQFPLPDAIFGFHAQQTCEKLLKALASANGVVYAFTHSLEKLIDLVEGAGEALPEMPYDLLKLEPFAVTFRYDIGGALDDPEKVQIRASVKMREFVIARILEIESLNSKP